MSTLVIGLIGLYCLTSFSQSVKYGKSGPISVTLEFFIIPAAISILWALALQVGWWTIAIFVIASLAGGTVNGLLIRHGGRDAAVDAQPIRALLFSVLAVAIWAPRWL